MPERLTPRKMAIVRRFGKHQLSVVLEKHHADWLESERVRLGFRSWGDVVRYAIDMERLRRTGIEDD